MAMAVTQIATAAAALAWMFAEWITRGKPSVLGILSGAVAGPGCHHAGLRASSIRPARW
jgi:ammonia channel protein AmtB